MTESRSAVVVEDDPDIRQLLVTVLEQAGFTVSETASGAAGIAKAREMQPDLVTLDLSLPDIDGIEVCRELRAFTDAYVVIITARGEEVDRLIGLEVGADDYLTKPFSPRELRARVAAMFRRPRAKKANPAAEGAEAAMRFGELEVDTESREVHVAGEPLELTKLEFDLLATLLSNPRRVWPRDVLLEQVWQTDWLGDGHVVDVHMANLRRKLGDSAQNGRYIRTVRGVGYRLGPG
ncbi:MAG TPA: response regulator transcription factor [Acidimicrobiales bacterium]|nr:response regulator transcription factor [Acidimicrobiales bacterium]